MLDTSEGFEDDYYKEFYFTIYNYVHRCCLYFVQYKVDYEHFRRWFSLLLRGGRTIIMNNIIKA